MHASAENPMDAGLATPDLLNALGDGAYITDLNRRIVFWNHAAERITGWSSDDVVGQCCSANILIHVDKDGRPLCSSDTCPLHRSMVTGSPSDEPVLVYAQTRRGTRIPVEVSVSPLRNATGRIIGGLETFRDASGMERDLLRALLIQRGLVASESPHPGLDIESRYAPRDIVGGDFFRVEQAPDGGVAVMLADVTGHGVAAALYTMLLRLLWDEQRERWHDPAAALEEMNRRVLPYAGEAGFFATAVALYLPPDLGTIRLVRAGHPPPILMEGDIVRLLGAPQLALGMVPEARYGDESFTWSVGDPLVLFTDGAIEIADASDHELGEEGLIALIQETRVDHDGEIPLAALEEKLLRCSACVRLRDDVALLKLCRRA